MLFDLLYCFHNASPSGQHRISNNNHLPFHIRDSQVAKLCLQSFFISLGSNKPWFWVRKYSLNSGMERNTCSKNGNKNRVLWNYLMSGFLSQHSHNLGSRCRKIVWNLQGNKLSNFLKSFSELASSCFRSSNFGNVFLDDRISYFGFHFIIYY